MNSIKRISTRIQQLLVLACWLMPMTVAYTWLFEPNGLQWFDHAIHLRVIPVGLPLLHPLQWQDQCLGLLISLMPLSLLIAGCMQMIRLFSRYKAGHLFTDVNARCFQRLAGLLFAWVFLIQFIYQALLTVALTWHNPIGHRILAISFDQNDILMLFAAVIIFLLGKIMAIAAQLQDEQQRMI